MFDFLTRLPDLAPVALTIREQARLEMNPLDLRYPAIFPQENVDSIRISDITTVDFRPLGGRRAWNADGREQVEKVGPLRDIEIIPINPTHHIDERALQILREPGIQLLVEKGVIRDVNRWVPALADAAERQVERDAFEAWFTNQITVYDTKSAANITVAAGINGARFVTEGTTWNTTVGDANSGYLRFMFHLQKARQMMGSVGPVRLRQATADVIVRSAPALIPGYVATLADVQDRIRKEGFPSFTFVIDERTYDKPNDGGVATTQTNYVPAHKVGFQPATGVVGRTFRAPVVRAYDFVETAGRRLNVNDVAIFLSPLNSGKTLLIEAQSHKLSLPDEQYTYVVDAGV